MSDRWERDCVSEMALMQRATVLGAESQVEESSESTPGTMASGGGAGLVGAKLGGTWCE